MNHVRSQNEKLIGYCSARVFGGVAASKSDAYAGFLPRKQGKPPRSHAPRGNVPAGRSASFFAGAPGAMTATKTVAGHPRLVPARRLIGFSCWRACEEGRRASGQHVPTRSARSVGTRWFPLFSRGGILRSTSLQGFNRYGALRKKIVHGVARWGKEGLKHRNPILSRE